ncbi:EAL domain-containing protein [Campylobacter californiensis]|uniref:EAL domain-containing protein n=1 Tax=Campylobacter californiensis TaxID=1032243 RepID=UPI0014764313|nr:EAL domain-containing protein [Campylobacter sp. RM12916]MBE3609640.1 EAL domain-containing protein [Campylobacter sp. RM12916]
MQKSIVGKTSWQVIKKLYIENLLALVAFVALCFFLISFKDSNIARDLEKLNTDINFAINRNFRVIEDDLAMKAKILNSDLQKEYSLITDKTLREFYNAFYIIDEDANLLYKREFEDATPLKSFNIPWIQLPHFQYFSLSRRFYKDGALEAVYASYELNNGKKIIVQIDLKLLNLSLNNALSQSNDIAYVVDRNGNLLTSNFAQTYDKDRYDAYIKFGEEFGNTRGIFSLTQMRYETISYIEAYKIFVISRSTKHGEILYQAILLSISFISFIAFIFLWIKDIKYIRNDFLAPLGELVRFLSNKKNKLDTQNITGDILTINDGITDLYKELDEAKMALEAYKKRFGYVFEQSFLNIIVYDAYTGDIVNVSNKALDVYGYSMEEMLSLNIRDIVYSTFADMLYDRRSSIENSKPFKTKHILKNGELRDMSVVVSNIEIDNQRLAFSVMRDITGVENESKINEILQKYIFVSPNMMMIADASEPFVIKQFTNNTNKILGIAEDKEFSFSFDVRNFITQESLMNFVSAIEVGIRLFTLNKNVSDSVRLNTGVITADGKKLFFKVYTKFILDDDNDISKIVYSFSDLTDEQQLQDRYELEIKKYKNVLWASSSVAWTYDAQSKEIQTSDEFAKMLGYNSKSDLGIIDIKRIRELAVDYVNDFESFFDEMKLEDGSYMSDIKFYARDRSVVWINMRGKNLEFSDDGKPLIINGVFRNIMKDQQFLIYQQMLSSVFSYAKDGIAIIDLNFNIIDANEAFLNMSGHEQEEVLSKNISEIKGVEFKDRILPAVKAQGTIQSKIWSRHKNGENRLETVNVSELRDNDANVFCYVVIVSSINDFAANKDYLEYIAYHDPLTKLPNRFLLTRKLDEMMNVKHKNIAVAYIDMDGFREINETYGHHTGDKLLLEISNEINKLFDDQDMLSRIGGDEFVALIPYEKKGEVYEMAQNMLRIASENIEHNGGHIKVSASIGVSMRSEENNVSGDDLLEQADWAMYQAKLAGKGGYYIFDVKKDRNFKNQYEDGLKISKALANNEFFIEYQPEVNIKTKQVVRYEALIRWNNGGEICYPDSFLPLIKKQYILDDIALFAIRKALGACALWNKNGKNIKVCVNLGIEQLCSDEFFNKFEALVESDNKLDTSMLIVEIVDSNTVENLPIASKILKRYKRYGINFSLDDFASRASSLEALSVLPIERFKTDKRLTVRMFASKGAIVILRMVRQISNMLHREVTIKNIENKRMLETLIGFGYECFQGNYFTKPLRLDEALRFEFKGLDDDVKQEYISDSEFERLRDYIELKSYANDIILYLTGDETIRGDFEFDILKDDISKKLKATNEIYMDIREKLISALEANDEASAIQLAQEVSLICDENLNL